MNHIFAQLENGTVFPGNDRTQAADIPWNPHPAFAGVALKHLVTGADTDGAFSAHLVRLEPGAEIGAHSHGTNWELHQVTEGSGVCDLEGADLEYRPGTSAVMPMGKTHRVRAGGEGLRILAFFAPALL